MCVSYVYLGGLVEGAIGMDVVIKNDDSDHDPHAKQECVLAAETTRIFPGNREKRSETRKDLKPGNKANTNTNTYLE